ncbi:winged helix-turn-helix transcriptional regulator [Streptomyces albidoflavus]|uniref:winged helix-turn-helix transcriptional regulator n=1 Tax=Streptomyces albidoflavus TaxID=1886 RepID=UPI00387326D8
MPRRPISPLVADGLLERRPYRTRTVRHEYVLTERGRSLRPVIVALVDFTTGQEAQPGVVGARTGERLDDSEAYVFTAGPTASAVMRGRYEEWGRA